MCEEQKVALKENITFGENKYLRHITSKVSMREKRKSDMDREQNKIPVLSFGLQKVITCPKAEISSLFYFS